MEQSRSIASVLFTDFVESTEKAAALGDRRWREILRQHHLFVREQLRRLRGEEIATTGDVFWPSSTIRRVPWPGHFAGAGFFLRLGVSLLMICLQMSTARAQDGPDMLADSLDRLFEECIERDSSTHGMLRCGEADHERWDEALNQAYGALMEGLRPRDAELLRESQRAWLQHRDREFQFIDSMYSPDQGSMFLQWASSYRTGIVRRRALVLREYVEGLDYLSDP